MTIGSNDRQTRGEILFEAEEFASNLPQFTGDRFKQTTLHIRRMTDEYREFLITVLESCTTQQQRLALLKRENLKGDNIVQSLKRSNKKK